MKFDLAVSVPFDEKTTTPTKVAEAVRKAAGIGSFSADFDQGFCDMEFGFEKREQADEAMARLIWVFPEANIYLTTWTIDADEWPEDEEMPSDAIETLAMYAGSPSDEELIDEKEGLVVSSRVGNA